MQTLKPTLTIDIWSDLVCPWCWIAKKRFEQGLNRFECKRAARTVLTGMCYSVGSATRQGSSSLTRFIGQSAITSSTWRR